MSTIDFVTECKECGSLLDSEALISRDRYGNPELKIIVELCEKCIETAAKEDEQ